MANRPSPFNLLRHFGLGRRKTGSRIETCVRKQFPFDQIFRKFPGGEQMEQTFSEFHSEILSVPRKVGMKFRRIGITG